MKFLIACVITLSLIGSALSTVTTNSPTTTAFANSTFNRILWTGNTTASNLDTANWANMQWGAVGPASGDNTTVYLWGIQFYTTPSFITVSRKLNATIIAGGSDTTEMSTMSGTTDNVITTTTASATQTTLRQATPMIAVGPSVCAFAASLGLVTASQTSTTTDFLILYMITPTAVSTKTIATVVGTSSFAVNQVWYEDGVFYVLYEAQTYASAGSTTTGIYIQGVFANGTGLLYTAASAAVTTTVNYAVGSQAALGTPLTMAKAANSNVTNSTYIYVIWNDLTVAAGNLIAVKTAVFLRATGAASTASGSTGTLATSTSAIPVWAAGIITYNGTANILGWVVGNYTSSVAGVAAYYNGATTVSNLFLTESSPSLTNGQITVRSTPYGTGYAVIASYPTSSGNVFVAQTYFYNGTVNTTGLSQTTIGTFATSTLVNAFADSNGAFWIGAVYLDATTSVVDDAYAGKLFAQINSTSSSSSSAGNVLATVAALVSFVIMSLFMF